MPVGRIILGLMLAFTGQFAVMNTMLLAGANSFATFVTGIIVFVLVMNVTVFLRGRR